MKKIGVMVGRERSFPDAFIAEVNRRSAQDGRQRGVRARAARRSAARLPTTRVILDRISHEVPFYQAYLKHAALQGVHVVNNPFWKLADDKFFGTGARREARRPRAEDGGAPEPRVHRRHHVRTACAASISWTGKACSATRRAPAFIKPLYGGGWKNVTKVRSVEELLRAYNQSGQLSMIVQEGIEWTAYVRCIVIGGEHVYPHLWDPSKPHHLRYTEAKFEIADDLMAEIVELSKKLCQALGYDMNTVRVRRPRRRPLRDRLHERRSRPRSREPDARGVRLGGHDDGGLPGRPREQEAEARSPVGQADVPKRALTIRAVIDRYHALLSGPLGRESASAFKAGMQAARLMFGDRPICHVLRPFFLTADEAGRLERDAASLAGAFRKAAGRSRSRSDVPRRPPALRRRGSRSRRRPPGVRT